MSKTEERKAHKISLGISGAALALAILSFGYTVVKDHFAGRSSDRRFGNIETSLRILTQTVAPQIYKSIDDSLSAALTTDAPQASVALSTVHGDLKQLRESRIPPNLESLKQGATALVSVTDKHPDLAEAWQTAGELISYRAEGTPDTQRLLDEPNLPNCTDSLPKPGVITGIIDPTKATVSPGSYENCRFTLDSERDNERLNLILQTTPLMTFKHCLIVYKGGEVNLNLSLTNSKKQLFIDGEPRGNGAYFSGPALEFEDCILVFTIQVVPPPRGRDTTRTLLAQNGTTLKLPNP